MLEVVEGTRHVLEVLEVVEGVGCNVGGGCPSYVRQRSCNMWLRWRRTCEVRAEGREAEGTQHLESMRRWRFLQPLLIQREHLQAQAGMQLQTKAHNTLRRGIRGLPLDT